MSVKQDLEDMIEEIRNERGSLENVHITRFGGAFVAIEDGKIFKVGKVYIDHCPLVERLYGKENVADLLKEAIESVIAEFGYFTDRREIKRNKISIPFGASEMTMYAINKNAIDAAVLVCDGAGTVIAPTADLTQGIGARINGIFYTSPIQNTIRQLQEEGAVVIDPKCAEINQLKGVEIAAKNGYKNIAVTISGADCDSLEKISDIEKRYSVNVTKLVVCTTGVSEQDAYNIKDNGDVVWSCASLPIREIVGPYSTLQISIKIPVFVVTEKGLDFVMNYGEYANLREKISPPKKYYTTSRAENEQGTKINFGHFYVFLNETDNLPIRTTDEPRPLI